MLISQKIETTSVLPVDFEKSLHLQVRRRPVSGVTMRFPSRLQIVIKLSLRITFHFRYSHSCFITQKAACLRRLTSRLKQLSFYFNDEGKSQISKCTHNAARERIIIVLRCRDEPSMNDNRQHWHAETSLHFVWETRSMNCSAACICNSTFLSIISMNNTPE